MSLKAYKTGSSFPELKKGVLRIYSSRICPYTERVRLVLAHKNITHELINIHIHEKPEWLSDFAPLGKVPVLQQDDKLLYESTAICEYLDDVFPGDRLQQDDPYKKAQDRLLTENIGKISSGYTMLMLSFANNRPLEDPEAKELDVMKSLKFFEEALAERDSIFFGGSTPKMLDFYIWPHMERVPSLKLCCKNVDVSETHFPKLMSWWKAMVELPAVKKEMFSTEEYMEMMKIRRDGKGFMDYGLKE